MDNGMQGEEERAFKFAPLSIAGDPVRARTWYDELREIALKCAVHKTKQAVKKRNQATSGFRLFLPL